MTFAYLRIVYVNLRSTKASALVRIDLRAADEGRLELSVWMCKICKPWTLQKPLSDDDLATEIMKQCHEQTTGLSTSAIKMTETQQQKQQV